MTTTAIDPMDMEDPFEDPASGGKLDEFKDQLVIIKPSKVISKPSKFPTADGSGKVDTVAAEIISVSGPEPGYTLITNIYSGSLVPQIKGKVGRMVLGRLHKEDWGKGEGWTLDAATPDDKMAAKAVLQAIKEREAAKASAEDPFA